MAIGQYYQIKEAIDKLNRVLLEDLDSKFEQVYRGTEEKMDNKEIQIQLELLESDILRALSILQGAMSSIKVLEKDLEKSNEEYPLYKCGHSSIPQHRRYGITWCLACEEEKRKKYPHGRVTVRLPKKSNELAIPTKRKWPDGSVSDWTNYAWDVCTECKTSVRREKWSTHKCPDKKSNDNDPSSEGKSHPDFYKSK